MSADCVNCAEVGARARYRRGLRGVYSTLSSYTPSSHSMWKPSPGFCEGEPDRIFANGFKSD